MPATRTPRKMSARELDAAMQNYAKSVYENPLMPGNLVYRMLPEQFQEMYRAPLGAALSGISYLTDRGTVKDVPKDINKAGKAIAQNAGSYLDLFNTVYNAISGTPQQGDPNYYRVSAGEAYQQAFNPEPADPRLERALDMYADPLVAAGSARRAANVLTDPALYRQIADELGGANRAYAIENLWHGSPHTFDRFDLSKIGTGEGAQAYGYGAYLAESPDVAKQYAKQSARVTPPPNRTFRGQELTPGTPEYHAATLLEHGGLQKAKKDLAKWIAEGSPDENTVNSWKSSLDFLNKAEKKSDFKVLPNENLYQSRLAWPDPAREAATPLKPEDFLDWDKPLAEQSPKVQNAVKSLIGKDWDETVENYPELSINGLPSGWAKTSGENILGAVYERLGLSPSGASQSLRDAGIPGIRYLDAGSRPANVVDKRLYDLYEKYGDVNRAVDEMMKSVYNTPKVKKQMREGYIKQLNESKQTRNYVVFDDKLIDIVARNNQPITKAAVPSAKKQLFVTIGGAQYPVADMLDAARKYQMYRQQADVGASMLPPVDIVDESGNVIANFSYNGRLWKGERGAADRVEIDPANYSE